MKKIILCILIIFSYSIVISQVKGKLFIIGGGTIPDYMIQKYVQLAGGVNSKYLIIPFASIEQKQSVDSFIKKLIKSGCSKIDYIIGSKEDIDNDSNLVKLKGVKAVFFTGGNQSTLVNLLQKSKLLEMIKNIYYAGGIIGGTSAGAAVMSEFMITGNELVNKDSSNAYNIIKKNNVQISAGFGFIKNAIIDQHFIKRKRFNRLISIILENPKLLGIGIDESTAIILDPDGSFDVSGESTVLILDASKINNSAADKNNNLSARNIQMHLLKDGEKYIPNNTLENK